MSTLSAFVLSRSERQLSSSVLVRSLALLAVSLSGCSGPNGANDTNAGSPGGGASSISGGANTTHIDNTSTGGGFNLGGAMAYGGTTSAVGNTSGSSKGGAGGASIGTGGFAGPSSGGSNAVSTGGTNPDSGGNSGPGTGGANKTGGGTSALGTGGARTGIGGTSMVGASGGAIGSGGLPGVGGSIQAPATGGNPGTGGTRSPATPGHIYNGIQWADTANNPIQAHGGGVIKVDGYYYWFGENRNPNGTFYAVSCYRSLDLVNWEFRNNVLTQNSSTELKPANIERPKVIYNATTKKYVMWMHWENGSDYGASRAGVASCDTVDGNYTYHGAARPMVNSGVIDHDTAGYQSRDCTAFVDSDGKGYFLSAANENYDLNLYLLKSDYLSIDSLAATLFKGGHREAPALFKRNNVYFLITSAATGWNPNQAQYATSSSLTSGWSSLTNVGDSSTFHSQSTFVIPVQGSSGTSYLYMGDRWAGAWGGPVNDSMYVWIPISFSSSTAMNMSWANTLTIDVGEGTVTGATNKFKYINKGSNLALSIDGASKSDGADAVQATGGNGSEQQWTISYDNAGYFKLTNVNSSLILDVNSSSTADGASVIQYTDNDGDNQKWRIVDKGAGYYHILNKHSDKVIEAPANSTTPGGALVQRAAGTNADNQLWKIVVP